MFIDLIRFPLAKMYDSHEIVEKEGSSELKTTIQMLGPLSFLWRKIVAENVLKGLEEQNARLIDQAKNV